MSISGVSWSKRYAERKSLYMALFWLLYMMKTETGSGSFILELTQKISSLNMFQ